MKMTLLFFVCALVVMTTIGAQAQNSPSRWQKQHLKQTELSLVKALSSTETPNIPLTAAKTIRQLEWMFPEEPFTELIAPLMHIVTDENSDTRTRLLAALALDGLHSDEGDKAIVNMGKSSANTSVRELCAALALNND